MSAQDIVEHVLGEAAAEVGGKDLMAPDEWLHQLGFIPYYKSEFGFSSWKKTLPSGSSLLVRCQQGEGMSLYSYDEIAHENWNSWISDDANDFSALLARLKELARHQPEILENVNDFNLKDVSLPTPIDDEGLTNRLELCLDELSHHAGDNLNLPFTLLMQWVRTPASKKVLGWDWPTFLGQVKEVYIPKLINAGMEMQADDLKFVIAELAKFHEPVTEAEEHGKDMMGPSDAPEVSIYSPVNPGDEYTAPHRIVLHKAMRPGEWVVHNQNMQNMGFSTGFYTEDYQKALKEFKHRCAKIGVDHWQSEEKIEEARSDDDGSWKELVKPTSAQEILDFMPPEFVTAYQAGEEYNWDNPHPDAYDWQPSYDGDREEDGDNPWTEVCYYPNFSTRDRKIFKVMMEVDKEGDHDFADEAEVGTKEEKQMDDIYGVEGYFEAMRDYWTWVIQHGTDPLGYIHLPKTEVTKRWIASFAREGERLKLTAVRRLGQEPAAMKVSFEQALAHAQQDEDWKKALEYLTVDANGYPEATLAEILAEGGEWNAQGLLIIRFDWKDQVAGQMEREALIKKAQEALLQMDKDSKRRKRRSRRKPPIEEGEDFDVKDMAEPPFEEWLAHLGFEDWGDGKMVKPLSGQNTLTVQRIGPDEFRMTSEIAGVYFGPYLLSTENVRSQLIHGGYVDPAQVEDWQWSRAWLPRQESEEDWKELVHPEPYNILPDSSHNTETSDGIVRQSYTVTRFGKVLGTVYTYLTPMSTWKDGTRWWWEVASDWQNECRRKNIHVVGAARDGWIGAYADSLFAAAKEMSQIADMCEAPDDVQEALDFKVVDLMGEPPRPHTFREWEELLPEFFKERENRRQELYGSGHYLFDLETEGTGWTKFHVYHLDWNPSGWSLRQVGTVPHVEEARKLANQDAIQLIKRTKLAEAGEEDWKELIPPEGVMPSMDEVTIKLLYEPERDINYKKEFKHDPGVIKWISNQLAKGNRFAWFMANVEASWFDPILKTEVTGNDYLGGCSYRSAKDFMSPSGYWPDMKERAYEDLLDNIRRKRKAMDAGEAPEDAAMESLGDSWKDLVAEPDFEERWVFTAGELDHPEECKALDRFVTPPVEGHNLGVIIYRTGILTSNWEDGSNGVTEEAREFAQRQQVYYKKKHLEEPVIADNWRDVYVDSRDGNTFRGWVQPPEQQQEALGDEGGKDLMGPSDSLNWEMSPDPDTPNLYSVTYRGEPLGTITRAHMLHKGDAWFWFTHSFIQLGPKHREAKVLGPFDTALEAAQALLKSEPDKLKESAEQLTPLLPGLAVVAQQVYDDWEQDEEGESFEYGVGGICQDIAEAMAGFLSENGIEAATVDNQGMGEQHVWTVAKLNDGVYTVDIEPGTYETGGGYCWKKRPGVTFSAENISVYRIDADPAKFEQYIGEGMDDDLVKDVGGVPQSADSQELVRVMSEGGFTLMGFYQGKTTYVAKKVGDLLCRVYVYDLPKKNEVEVIDEHEDKMGLPYAQRSQKYEFYPNELIDFLTANGFMNPQVAEAAEPEESGKELMQTEADRPMLLKDLPVGCIFKDPNDNIVKIKDENTDRLTGNPEYRVYPPNWTIAQMKSYDRRKWRGEDSQKWGAFMRDEQARKAT